MSLKRNMCVLVVLLLLIVLPIEVQAVNDDLRIVKSNDDYVIYIEGYENKEFSFAFSNNAEVNVADLNYINNWTDSEGIHVACLDNGFGLDLTQKVFVWVKDVENNDVLSKVELDLNEVLDLAQVSELSSLTERISVDLTKKDLVDEVIDGITTTKESGKIVITEKEESKTGYKYDLYKLEDGNNASELVKLLKDSENLTNKSMIERIDLLTETEESLDALVKNANWQAVSDMEIKQPEESVTGDKYLVLLQKTDANNNIETDLQVLECYDKETQAVAMEKVPVRTTSILPVTGEQLEVYVFLGIVIVLIVLVVIRIVFLMRKNKNENK